VVPQKWATLTHGIPYEIQIDKKQRDKDDKSCAASREKNNQLRQWIPYWAAIPSLHAATLTCT